MTKTLSTETEETETKKPGKDNIQTKQRNEVEKKHNHFQNDKKPKIGAGNHKRSNVKGN